MVGIKDFNIPSCCSECQMASCKGLSGQFYCDITTYDVDMDDTERDADCPLIEAIPKDQYEARLKAEKVSMFEEIQLEIEESENCGKAFHLGLQMASNIIQQKIDKLKENEDGNNIRFYIPDSLTIPTDLILYVEDTYVNYKRIHGGFRFHIHEDDEIKAMGIAKQIADRMIFEHDESEHGVTWCTVEFKIVEQEERYKIGTDIDWFYRIRDSY